ncbi:MAG: VWA domain-containing protein, partial [Bacteroidota bacterium]|nr:VWA domain-containing protein [Bacteroidota bacterium]
MNETTILWVHPEYLWLLVLVPLLPVAYAVKEGLRRRRLRRFGDEELVRELMPSWNPAIGWVKVVLFALAFGLFVVGLARPRTGSKYAEKTVNGSHIVIALDVSNSMLAQDYSPNRLERAKYAIRRLTRSLEGNGRRADRIGLVVFAGDAYVQLPVTSDYASAELFLDGISTNSVAIQGTDIAKALTVSSRCLMDESDAGKAIVLISDGESHEDDPVPVAEAIHGNGIDIFTIGVGDTRGTPILIDGTAMKDEDGKIVTTRLDEKILGDIAAAGGGAYLHATDRDF